MSLRGGITENSGRVRLTLSREGLQEFATTIQRLGISEEVRVEARGAEASWVIFWKLRSGETRLLLAHPEADQWVATCAMTSEFAQEFTQQLLSLEEGQFTCLPSDSLPISRMSNLSLEVAFE